MYAMIEAIVRAKGVLNAMKEIGVVIADHIQLFTDSSAAKSFVSRTGLGKMKHLEIRDLWLQREVGLGRVLVYTVEGPRNPADLMTKYLKRWEIEVRLGLLGIKVSWSPECRDLDKGKLEEEINELGRSLLRRRVLIRGRNS